MINDNKRKLKERKGRSNERNLKERERGFQRKNGGSISDHRNAKFGCRRHPSGTNQKMHIQ
jgi:hypothetical protein